MRAAVGRSEQYLYSMFDVESIPNISGWNKRWLDATFKTLLRSCTKPMRCSHTRFEQASTVAYLWWALYTKLVPLLWRVFCDEWATAIAFEHCVECWKDPIIFSPTLLLKKTSFSKDFAKINLQTKTVTTSVIVRRNWALDCLDLAKKPLRWAVSKLHYAYF